MVRPAAAEQLAKNQKRILCFYMAGGLSQLESWNPKPKTDTGGPFRAIPTSVPGVHISELLPNVAKQMHHLMIGARRQHQGRRSRQGRVYDDDRPSSDAGRRLSYAGRRHGQGPRAGRYARSPGTSASRRAAAAGDQTTRLISARAMPASCSATATRRPISARDGSLSLTADEQRNLLRRQADERFLLAPLHGADRCLHV